MKNHKPLRSTQQVIVRPTIRSTVRVCWRAPDDLGAALAAFRRAIRCRRRLARLAPRFFDSVVVNHERMDRAETARWMAIWEPALAKVYGDEHKPWHPLEDHPPLLHPNTQRAVNRELASLELWMEAGRIALDSYRRRRPQDRMDLSRLAQLLQIASDFGRLACGIDPDRPPSEPHDDAAVEADLRRAYG